jgi:hypothetical protein
VAGSNGWLGLEAVDVRGDMRQCRLVCKRENLNIMITQFIIITAPGKKQSRPARVAPARRPSSLTLASPLPSSSTRAATPPPEVASGWP